MTSPLRAYKYSKVEKTWLTSSLPLSEIQIKMLSCSGAKSEWSARDFSPPGHSCQKAPSCYAAVECIVTHVRFLEVSNLDQVAAGQI